MKKKRCKSGKGLFDDINKLLKQTKIISKAGEVLLPLGGSAIGSALGGPGIGTAAGGIAGSAANEWIKSQGYGKRSKRGCGPQSAKATVRLLYGGDSRLVIQPNGMRVGQKRGMGSGATTTQTHLNHYASSPFHKALF
jgi:hypothetical protein